MFNKVLTSQESEYKKFIYKLVIFTGFVILLLFVYKILDILIILFFALFLNMLFAPFLNWLNKYKIRDSLGMALIYLIILILFFITIFSVVPIFIKQILFLVVKTENGLISVKDVYLSEGIDGFHIPQIFKMILSGLDFTYIIDYAKSNISSIGLFFGNNFKNFLTNGVGLLSVITGAFINFALLTIFTFFIALERKQIREFFYQILPTNTSKYLLSKESIIIDTLYNWIKGQLLLCISIFFLTLIGLLILKLFGISIGSYFTLSLIAGVMEFIPYIGPLLAFLPALALALGFSYKVVIAIIILYITIQQIESNFFVPYIMSKTMSISPFLVLIAMTIGGSIFGIVGILIAVPIVSVLQIFVGDYLKTKK